MSIDPRFVVKSSSIEIWSADIYMATINVKTLSNKWLILFLWNKLNKRLSCDFYLFAKKNQ